MLTLMNIISLVIPVSSLVALHEGCIIRKYTLSL